MEYNLEKKCIGQLTSALDTAAEQPVDIELTLPDYCPDIERILCCKLIPKVYMSGIGADRLNIEGGSCVRVMYVDGDRGCIRSYEYTQPFSESIPVGELPSDCAVITDLKPEYINCRALSPRKLSLHGAFSLRVKVCVKSDLCYCSDSSDNDLQIRRECMEVSDLSGLCTESFTVQEEIPAGAKTEINSVLSHRLSAKITELKAMHGKIMLSAELKLELMYLSDIESCKTECMSYSLPVSRVIDCDGADESSVIDGRLDVMSDELRLGGDALDGSALLSLEAKLCFSAVCYNEREIGIILDAFSTDREAETRLAPFSCVCSVLTKSFSDIGKAAISVDNSISEIIDLHCERLTVTPTAVEGGAVLEVRLRVSMMYRDTDGELRCVERDAEFSFKPDTGGRECVESVQAGLDSLSYRMTDSTSVELRAELCFRLTLSSRRSCAALTSVRADDDAPARRAEGSLILYYTDSGDNVWDISKRFCSRPEDIIAENDIDGDTVEGGVMLLIPTA